MALTVARLGAEVALTPDAIRYYERKGLLLKAERSPAGYRLFDESAVERLRFVKGARRLGLRVDEIRELLDVRDRGLCPCGHAESLVQTRLAELDAEIAHMSEIRAELARLLTRYPARECTDTDAAAWDCAAEFARIGGDVHGGSSVSADARLPLPSGRGQRLTK